MFDVFSRTRSEGFTGGVWGWTCVRRVARVVVVSSLRRRRRCRRELVVNSLISPLWGAHTHCDTILSFKV